MFSQLYLYSSNSQFQEMKLWFETNHPSIEDFDNFILPNLKYFKSYYNQLPSCGVEQCEIIINYYKEKIIQSPKFLAFIKVYLNDEYNFKPDGSNLYTFVRTIYCLKRFGITPKDLQLSDEQSNKLLNIAYLTQPLELYLQKLDLNNPQIFQNVFVTLCAFGHLNESKFLSDNIARFNLKFEDLNFTYISAMVSISNQLENIKWLDEHFSSQMSSTRDFGLNGYSGAIGIFSRYGNLEAVKWLLQEKSINFCYTSMADASTSAAQFGHLELLKFLNMYLSNSFGFEILTHMRTPNSQTLFFTDNAINSIITNAATYGHDKIFIWILNNLTNSNNDKFKISEWLIEAARHGHLSILQAFKLFNLDNIDELYFCEAFVAACENGHLITAQYLQETYKNITPFVQGNIKLLTSCNYNQSILTNVVFAGHLTVVSYLCNFTDNIDLSYFKHLLERAIPVGHLEIIKSLTERYSNFKPKINFKNLLYTAVINRQLDIIKWIFEISPDVDYQSTPQPIVHCATNGNYLIFQHLLTLPYDDLSIIYHHSLLAALENREDEEPGYNLIINMIARWADAHGFRAQVDQILGPTGIIINYAQSIHADSVHASVSASILRLSQIYQAQIDTDEKFIDVLSTIMSRVQALPVDTANPSDMNGAALRYIKDLVSPATGSHKQFTDHKSKISTQRAIALTYLASQDLLRLHPGVTIELAFSQFVRGCYEVQRGYNFEKDDTDNCEKEDKIICASGAFNKHLEVLHTIHKDVDIVILSKSNASLKLQTLVKNASFLYLKQCFEQSIQKSDPSLFFVPFKNFKEHGPESIWDKIEEHVRDELFEEFGSIYDNNKQAESFTTLINFGKCIVYLDIIVKIETECLKISPRLNSEANKPNDKDSKSSLKL